MDFLRIKFSRQNLEAVQILQKSKNNIQNVINSKYKSEDFCWAFNFKEKSFIVTHLIKYNALKMSDSEKKGNTQLQYNAKIEMIWNVYQ